MNHLSFKSSFNLYRASQIRQVELRFAKNNPQGTYPLMQAAGKAAFQQLQSVWPDARKILVLTGKGNNGGDGYLLARLASEQGLKVTLCPFFSADQIQGDAILALNSLAANSVQMVSWDKLKHKGESTANLKQYDLIVDAMLGTGIQGAVREPFVEAIAAVNCSGVPVLAIDVPSGLNADSGHRFNQAVKANATITFVAHKRGLFTAEAVDHIGQLQLATLDIPPECFTANADEPTVVAQNWHSLKGKLQPRKSSAHKGSFGRCHLIGGARGMLGAAVLAATAAARSGSGLTAASVEKGASSLVNRCPEVMALSVGVDDIEVQMEKLENASTLIVGPGLGRSEWAQSWMQKLNGNPLLRKKYQVWDADALFWLANNADFDAVDFKGSRILTPHPGEAARLLGISVEEVAQDRFAASEAIVRRYGGVCVLKGAGTIVSQIDRTHASEPIVHSVCCVGNPAMASGGMGDVLAGIIGALLAQGFEPYAAATLGVCIHGEAGDRAAAKLTQHRGMLASDLFSFLPALLNP